MPAIEKVTLSILMPCLNEARSLPNCIAKAKSYLARQPFSGEIVIADNGSTDGSREIAESLGVHVIASKSAVMVRLCGWGSKPPEANT